MLLSGRLLHSFSYFCPQNSKIQTDMFMNVFRKTLFVLLTAVLLGAFETKAADPIFVIDGHYVKVEKLEYWTPTQNWLVSLALLKLVVKVQGVKERSPAAGARLPVIKLGLNLYSAQAS